MRSVPLLLLCAAGCKDKDTPADDTSITDDRLIKWEFVEEDSDLGAFLSVWGPTPDDVWIVGGQPETGVVLRGNASDGFSELALPDGVPLLNWVHGSSATDIWIGGVQGALLHWNGSAWTDHSLGIEEAVWGTYVLSETEAWLVGGSSGFGGDVAIAKRWDGSSWTDVALPGELEGLDNLFKVHHDGDQLWMVGHEGVALAGDGELMGLVGTGTTADLVTANRPAEGGPLLVVGGRGTGVVLEDTGGALTVTTKANAGLNGVNVYPSGTRAMVVGEGGYSALYDFDSDTLTEELPITLDVLHATWGTAGGDTFAVGGNLFTADDFFHGVILVAPSPE